ncbi:MAG: bifunctional DNA primase/polymerase [Candidatus Acidiferrales bacterium]
MSTNQITNEALRASEEFLRLTEPSKPVFQTFRERANYLLARGIPVIPLQVKSKDPCTPHAAYDATTDPTLVARWVKQHNKASNCAAVAKYEGYWFADDDMGTLAQKYKEDTGQDLPQTLTVKTSRGFHYYFKHDEASRAARFDGHENSGVIIIPGYKGEARCNNQYVVAPGSVHPSGSIYEVVDDAPIVAAPVELLEWYQRAYALSESLKPESEKPKGGNGKFDPGFRKLFDAVEYRPLIKRVNALGNASLRIGDLHRGSCVPCPMPKHEHGDYSDCFGPIKNVPELLHCLGNCQWTGDMVAACYQIEGGKAKYKNMYECARAICAEEGLKFDDFFPATPQPCVEGSQSEIGDGETEPEIVDEPIPEFPAITGSIQDLAEALCPDIPREFKIMAVVTRVGLAISGKVQLEGELHLQPRFYTCFIAEPGRGKTAAIKETRIINTAFREVPSVDSAPALVDAFAESSGSPRCILLSPDEAVDLFEKGKTSRDSRNSLFTELLKLYEDNVTGN